MIQENLKRFGPEYAGQLGYIVEFDGDREKHSFGGKQWKIDESKFTNCHAFQVVTLDLSDDRLRDISKAGHLLPLVIGAGAPDELLYTFDNASVKILDLKYRHQAIVEENNISYLPKEYVSLRAMIPKDSPVTEEDYWEITSRFVGGDDFIRILGSPIWMQWVQQEYCTCGMTMKYFSSIGYGGNGTMDGMRFFMGEFASYFFLCEKCHVIKVVVQSV